MELELPPFDSARVLVVGDLMLDRYYQGPTSRVSPEAPVPVLQVRDQSERPGGAGNVALNLASLGVGTTLCAATGDDAEADSLARALAAAGIECHLGRQAGLHTTTKLRVLSRHQQLLRMDFEEASLPLPDDLPVQDQLAGADILLLSDYGRGVLASPQTLVTAARARGLTVLVDPKGADFARFHGATLLTPNRQEFEAVVGPCDSDAQLDARGQALARELDLEALLVTRGEQGMTLVRPNRPALHLPARAVDVFDVTGAGDTVIATLAAALAAGTDLDTAVVLANVAAGLSVAQSGAGTVSAPELALALAGGRGPAGGVVTQEQLVQSVEQARQRGERVVFTNGCFDILHAGHVAYLEEAASMGERLVVAVNSDDSVRALKGEGRPLNSLERRMAVLAALGSVDWVVPFAEDTPETLLRQLRPDVLVKGGDYASVEDVVGADIVRGYGGEVRLTGQVEGLSTSATVSQIREVSKD